MKDDVEYIEPIEPADEEINHWLEVQEKLHKKLVEAMRLPDEFFGEGVHYYEN